MVFLACRSLQPYSPSPNYLQHRVPKALAVPRVLALCPTLTTQGQLSAALGAPSPPLPAQDPLSNTRQAAPRTINTVINREPRLTVLLQQQVVQLGSSSAWLVPLWL